MQLLWDRNFRVRLGAGLGRVPPRKTYKLPLLVRPTRPHPQLIGKSIHVTNAIYMLMLEIF